MKFGTFVLVMAVILGAVLAALTISPETGRTAGLIALAVLGVTAVAEVRSAKSQRAGVGSKR